MCKTVKMNRSNMNIDDPSEEIYGYNRTFDLWEQSEPQRRFSWLRSRETLRHDLSLHLDGRKIEAEAKTLSDIYIIVKFRCQDIVQSIHIVYYVGQF